MLRCRQEGGVGRDEKKERKERKVFPATTHASKDTPKEERRRFPAMTKASRDMQGGRKEREKERKKERGRERERREKRKRQVFPATNKRPGTHQRKREVILSVAFRKTPGSKERKGEGKGERRGLRSQQVPIIFEAEAPLKKDHLRDSAPGLVILGKLMKNSHHDA